MFPTPRFNDAQRPHSVVRARPSGACYTAITHKEATMGDFSFSFRKAPGAKPAAEKNTFEAAENQFNAIRGCGISPYPKVTLETLIKGQEPAAFEQSPFALMLSLMGGANDQGEPLSDDV